MKRYSEVKAGVIVSSLGIALGILLFVLMGGLAASGKVSQEDSEILSRLWVVGVMPLLVGLALITNGIVVSKKLVERARRGLQMGQEGLVEPGNSPLLRSADAGEFPRQPFSVTEQTTKHLSGLVKK